MALGQLQSEADLEQFVRGVLDRHGLGRPDSGLKDGSVGKAKLATDALNAFLKLAAAADRKVSFGSSSVTYTAAVQSATVNVAHGLGVVPVIALATVTGVRGQVHVIEATARDATNVTFQGTTPAAVSVTVTFDWLAIG